MAQNEIVINGTKRLTRHSHHAKFGGRSVSACRRPRAVPNHIEQGIVTMIEHAKQPKQLRDHDQPRLSLTDVRVLTHLYQCSQGTECKVTLTNKQLSRQINRSVRTIQESLSNLVRCNVIERKKIDINDPFSLITTSIQNIDLAKKLSTIKHTSHKENNRTANKKTTRSTKTDLERYPFRYLRVASRIPQENFHASMQAGQAYWEWLSDAMKATNMSITIHTAAQKRKLSTGKRGGVVPRLYRRFTLSGEAVPQLHSFAIRLMETSHEGTFRVVETDHPLILVDDVSGDKLTRLPGSAATIETSPNNFQATLVAPRALSREERLAVQRALISLVDGDRAANSNNQLRRFPGSINNKPELEVAFVSRTHTLPLSKTLSDFELGQLLVLGQSLQNWNTNTANTSAKKENTANPSTEGTHDASAVDPSGQDYGFTIQLLRQRVSEQEIINQIAERAAIRKKYGFSTKCPAHFKYAALTLESARKIYRQRNTEKPTVNN